MTFGSCRGFFLCENVAFGRKNTTSEGRVFRLGKPGSEELAHTVMLCPGGLICLAIAFAALVGIDYLVDILSEPKQ